MNDEGKQARRLIEALHAAGRVPRLLIDSTAEGVDVPGRVRQRHGQGLLVDLDPAYPLSMAMGEEGFGCCLSFDTVAVDCFFPWESVHGVFDRGASDGRGSQPAAPDQCLDRGTSVEERRPRLRLIRGGLN